MNIICCDNFAEVFFCIVSTGSLPLKCNLGYELVNQCVVSSAQLNISYDVVSEILMRRLICLLRRMQFVTRLVETL